MIIFFQKGQMSLILGDFFFSFFFFHKYKESFAHVVAATMSVQEHFFSF